MEPHFTNGTAFHFEQILSLMNAVFWDVTPCGSSKNRRFGETRRNIPEDGIHHSHRRENLRSYIKYYSSLVSDMA
jgi:hypothetical protein